jgi:hypothetical protein
MCRSEPKIPQYVRYQLVLLARIIEKTCKLLTPGTNLETAVNPSTCLAPATEYLDVQSHEPSRYCLPNLRYNAQAPPQLISLVCSSICRQSQANCYQRVKRLSVQMMYSTMDPLYMLVPTDGQIDNLKLTDRLTDRPTVNIQTEDGSCRGHHSFNEPFMVHLELVCIAIPNF